IRLRNGLKYARLTASGGVHLRRLKRRVGALSFDRHASADAMYRAIDARVSDLFACYAHHLVTSTAAGALAPTLVEIAARGRAVTEADHALVASWLAGARDVESHDIAAGIGRIARRILADRAAAAWLASASNDDAAEWLA